MEADSTKRYVDPQAQWNKCLSEIKKRVPFMTYNTWFTPIKPVSANNGSLIVELPNEFFWEWIAERHNGVVDEAVKAALGVNARLEFLVAEEQIEDEPEPEEPTTTDAARAVIESAAPSLESNLNPNLTFERYVKGESNQLAFAAASAVAKKPGGTSFNPLFIYGGVGLGKTHLLQAVGDEARRRDERLRARYVSANEFTMDFVNAIQSNQANDFASFYKSVDLLLIDDIQFLTGRERTQELFFNIFNSLHQSGKQIVMTSDKPPKDLDGMDERLVSRFHWGLTADIQPPDFETRMAIVNKKLEEYGAAAPSDVVEYVASRVDSNIRELEGCLVKIVANASLAGKPIDVNAAKLAVGEVMAREKPRLTVERITEIVCEAFDVEVKDARSKSRKKAIVEARRGAMYFARMFSNGSMKSIGKYFGGRDHSTVVHALKAVDAAVDNDERFRRTIDEIKKKIETERR